MKVQSHETASEYTCCVLMPRFFGIFGHKIVAKGRIDANGVITAWTKPSFSFLLEKMKLHLLYVSLRRSIK